MCRKLFYLLSLVLVLGLVGNASAGLDDDPNLVGWYKFDDTGDIGLDSSTALNHGDPCGNAQIVNDGKRGLVLDVHAQDQQPTIFGYVNLGLGVGDPNLVIREQITLAAWIWVRSFSMTDIPGDNEWEGIITKGHDWRLTRFGCQDPDYVMQFNADALGSGPAVGTTDVWDGRWHHVAGVYDTSAKLIYVDGELEGEMASSGIMNDTAHPNTAVWIGGQWDRPTGDWRRYFDGRIDDARIYNRFLSADEVKELFRAGMMAAHFPKPSDKSAIPGDERENLNLSWEPGTFADTHNVYFGGAPGAMTQIGFDQAPNNITLASVLELEKTYYWQVDEVNTTHPLTPWPGPVWEFTVGNCLTMDDFVPYDGFVAGGGVGYLPSDVVWSVEGSAYVYLELTVCYETPQSMKINYYNSLAPYYSGSKREFSPAKNWSGATDNVKALDVAFKGLAANDPGEELYVELSDSSITRKVTCTPDLTSTDWQVWHIDLADFSAQGLNLSDVNSIEIGLGNGTYPGSLTQGFVYIDDIRLYTPRTLCEVGLDAPAGDFTGDCFVDALDLKMMTDAWLAAGYISGGAPIRKYNFDTDPNDSSGYNNHGTLYGGATVVDGLLVLDGVDDCVTLDNWHAIPGDPLDGITVAAWVYHDGMPTGNPRILQKGWQYALLIDTGKLCLEVNGLTNGWLEADPPSINQWHHIAGTYDSAEIAIWVDGVKVASEESSGTIVPDDVDFFNIGTKEATSGAGDHWKGYIDDVVIYDFALGAEEIEELMKGGGEPGLMAHYKFDEISGTVASDSSGHRNHGTLINFAGTEWTTSGVIGGALVFNNTNLQYVTAPDSPSLNGPTTNGAITVAAWVKPTYEGFGGWANNRIVEKSESYALTPDDADSLLKFKFDLRDGLPNSKLLVYPIPVDGVWTHVTGTYDGANMKIYFDGVLQGEMAVTGVWTEFNNALCIGTKKAGSGAGDGFNGTMDDVRIYNYALTKEEIKNIMVDSELGLVAHYKFDETSGLVAADSSGCGNNGALINFTGTEWTTDGVIGGALDFNNTLLQYVTAPDSESLNSPTANSAITISAWVKPTYEGFGGWANNRIVEKSESYALTPDDAAGDLWFKFDLRDGLPGSKMLVYPPPTDGVWTNVTATYDGETMKIYYNGTLKGEMEVINVWTEYNYALCVGTKKAGSGAGDGFNGTMDDVRIYNRALSEAEVLAMIGGEKGLMAHYKFDETSGLTASDSSGRGNDGALINFAGTEWTTGVVDGALAFNNTNSQYVTAPDSPSLNGPSTAGAITIAVWAKPTYEGFGGWANNRLVEKSESYALTPDDAGSPADLWFKFDLRDGLPNSKLLVYPPPTDGVWTHVTGTYDGETMKIYYNGALQGEMTVTDVWTEFNYALCIGTKKAGTGAGDHFNGIMDDVRIYDYAITEHDIIRVMNGYDLGGRRYFPLLGSQKMVDLVSDDLIDFKDFAILAQDWLKLWP